MEETEKAISKSIESLPQELFKSLTWDNGKEGVCHTKIRDGYNIETYFCDPYASWQKGGVENLNGLIREYLPRETNMATITDEDIYRIQEKFNNRPRKKLGYLTPNKALAAITNQLIGALNPWIRELYELPIFNLQNYFSLICYPFRRKNGFTHYSLEFKTNKMPL